MRIFGPLPWPTISPVTVTPARACASLVTVSPSTRSSAGRVTVSPASPTRRLTVNRSPTATLCCRPPALTTAYTTELLDRLCRVLRAPGRRAPGAGRVARLPGGTVWCPAGAVQPDQRTRAPTAPPQGPTASSRAVGAAGSSPYDAGGP